MSTRDVDEAVNHLSLEDNVISVGLWPGTFDGLDRPGLYSWWVDDEGAEQLTLSIGHRVDAGLAYIGQTGANVGKRKIKSTLGKRVRKNHLRNSSHGSTLRRTIAASLMGVLDLMPRGNGLRAFTKPCERQLTLWMYNHLSIAVWPYDDRDTLEALEVRVLRRLDPPINLDHMDCSEVRRVIKNRRKDMFL